MIQNNLKSVWPRDIGFEKRETDYVYKCLGSISIRWCHQPYHPIKYENQCKICDWRPVSLNPSFHNFHHSIIPIRRS